METIKSLKVENNYYNRILLRVENVPVFFSFISSHVRWTSYKTVIDQYHETRENIISQFLRFSEHINPGPNNNTRSFHIHPHSGGRVVGDIPDCVNRCL